MSRRKIHKTKNKSPKKRIAFQTKGGTFYRGDVVSVLKRLKHLRGKVQLIVTSPPFPLNKKKSYGNLNGKKYLDWFISLAPKFAKMLKPDGSIVIEIGNAWEHNRPVQSLLPLESLMGFLRHKKAGFRLCQEFICYNPSRLPSPAAWVMAGQRTTDTKSFSRPQPDRCTLFQFLVVTSKTNQPKMIWQTSRPSLPMSKLCIAICMIQL